VTRSIETTRVASAFFLSGAAALVYFAVLGACGVRPRQFMRRG